MVSSSFEFGPNISTAEGPAHETHDHYHSVAPERWQIFAPDSHAKTREGALATGGFAAGTALTVAIKEGGPLKKAGIGGLIILGAAAAVDVVQRFGAATTDSQNSHAAVEPTSVPTALDSLIDDYAAIGIGALLGMAAGTRIGNRTRVDLNQTLRLTGSTPGIDLKGPIPSFTAAGELPPGEYEVTWEQFVLRFGGTPRRDKHIENIERVGRLLAEKEIDAITISGSMASKMRSPGDFDGYIHSTAHQDELLRTDPNLHGLGFDKVRMKQAFGGELYGQSAQIDTGFSGGSWDLEDAEQFFRYNRQNRPIGVVTIDLKTLPQRSAQPATSQPRFRQGLSDFIFR